MDLLVRGAVDLSQTQSEKNSPLFGKKKGGEGSFCLSRGEWSVHREGFLKDQGTTPSAAT